MVYLEILNIIALVVLILFLKNYFPSYFNKKAENLATKEDIGEITKQVESIKHLYSADLESLRATMGAQLYIHQTRYQNEFNILRDLSEKIVELKGAVLSLRPTLDHINLNEPEEERKLKRLNLYNEAAVAFGKLYETRKPFYPEEIYGGITKLSQLIRKEAIEYAITSDRGKDFDPKYWDKAMANAEQISKLTDEIMEFIRNRVKYWEEFKIKS
jgi:hypothetical protein